MRFTIELTDRGEFDREADAITIEQGALRFTSGGYTNLVVAYGVWRSVRTADTEPLLLPAQTEAPRRPLQVLPVYDPDIDR